MITSSRREFLQGTGALVVGFAVPLVCARATAAAHRGCARQDARYRRRRRLHRRQCGRLGDDLLRQGRPRPGPAHRHSADGRRGARHRRRADRDARGRHGADPRPGRDGRQQRHHARRHPDSPGRGDGTAGVDRARQRAQRQARGGPRHRRRRGAAEERRRRHPASASSSATSASTSSWTRRRSCATRRHTRSSASRSRGPTSRRRSVAATSTCTTSWSTACCTVASCGRRPSARRSSPSTRASIASIPGARVVRVKDFLGVVAADEWDAMSAARLLDARWSESATLLGADSVRKWMRSGPFEGDETLVKKGDAQQALADAKKVTAEFYWPVQSHASMGPSCAIADVRDGKATVWSASQATHRFRETIAKALALPKDAVRVVYLDGAGCYGMNGHDDAATDAALMSKAVGRPVRVQWSRAGRARLGSEGAAAAAGTRRLGDGRRQDRCVAHRDVDPQGNGEPAEHAAAGARCRRHRADAGHHDGPHQPERRSALRGAAPGSARALAEGRAAAAVEFPRAGQGRELLRRRKLHRHARRGRAARSGRIPAAGADRSARHRGDPAHRRADRLAAAAVAGAARHRQRARLRVHPLQAQRKLRRDRDGSRRRQGVRRDPRAPRRLRARLRTGHQPVGADGADRRQHPADAVAHAVRGSRIRPLARDERRLGELSDPALPRCAGSAGRHRRPAAGAAARRGRSRRPRRCLRRWRTPCSTRSACGSRRCRSRASACARRSPDAACPAVR